MDFSQASYADVRVIAVKGRVDHANADQFKTQLWPILSSSAASGEKLLLNLSGLEYISSAGLRVLMLAARELKARQGTLVVCEPQAVVKEIFEISRFNVVFRVYPDLKAALADLSERAVTAYAQA